VGISWSQLASCHGKGSGTDGSNDPTNPSAGGRGGDGNNGEDGHDADPGQPGATVHVWMTLKSVDHPLLQVRAASKTRTQFFLIDPNGGTLTVNAGGGSGGKRAGTVFPRVFPGKMAKMAWMVVQELTARPEGLWCPSTAKLCPIWTACSSSTRTAAGFPERRPRFASKRSRQFGERMPVMESLLRRI
jgi:hypothetical protein